MSALMLHACCMSALMLHACHIPNACVLTPCVILCTFPACSSKVLQQAHDCIHDDVHSSLNVTVLNEHSSVD